VFADARSKEPPSTRTHVFVVEPNVAVREGIVDILASERYEVEVCASLGQVIRAAASHPRSVALVAWQGMDGLLTEEHRHELVEFVRRLHLVIMVPRRWARLLDTDAVGRAELLEKPFDGDGLLASIRRASSSSLDQPAAASH
jgi:FixJ family two-component response regulator